MIERLFIGQGSTYSSHRIVNLGANGAHRVRAIALVSQFEIENSSVFLAGHCNSQRRDLIRSRLIAVLLESVSD